MLSLFKALIRIKMVVCSFFGGKVRGEAHSTPALQELMAPGWEAAEWKIVLPALPGRSAPVGPPSQFFARSKYTACADIAVGDPRECFSTLLISSIILHQKCLQTHFTLFLAGQSRKVFSESQFLPSRNGRNPPCERLKMQTRNTLSFRLSLCCHW